MPEVVSVRRPVGHITDLIRRLSRWRDRRQGITDRPKRVGKPLPNTELDQAIAYLEEYRELMAGGQTDTEREELKTAVEKVGADLGAGDQYDNED